jgi:peptidoglycan/LPS O-acetylase OafA/YrhL
VLYRFRDQVPLRLELAALGTVAWLILPLASAGYWVGAVIVPYTAVTLAFHTPASWRRLTRRGDFSYGLYLWAFPVQQIFGQIRGITTAEMIVVALPVSYLLGGASWLLLERHAMRFRSGRTRRPMITAPAPASGAATEAG